MIRRISKNNDLKDLIKSCPSGVIDDITEIRYFISGQPQTEIVADFEKVGNHLEAILPTSDLETLSNGVLMRRAFYKVSDPAYPDGYYNLEFVDNLAVWLGDEETEDPYDPGYLTEDDLKTINGDSIVGVGNIDVVNYIPDYYATKSWVSDQGYITSETLPEDIATQSWVSSNFLSTTALSGYATESWVQSQQFATESWVQSQGYQTQSDVLNNVYSVLGEGEYVTLTDIFVTYSVATESWVSSQNFLTSTSLTGYATESWVQSQGYITSAGLSGLATQSWVESYVYECGFAAAADLDALSRWVVSQNYATQSWVSSQQFITSAALTGYATESWVQSQGFVSNQNLSSYATKSWVSSQDFLTSTSLTGYATESWVQAQGYLTSHQDLSSYATKSWVSTNYLEESKVWCGTREQWNRLTPEEQASYKIALVTA